MKFRIQFKDPDGVYDSVRYAVETSIQASKDILGGEGFEISDDEMEMVREARTEKYNEFIKSWVGHGEYVTIEFDTETNTATVVKKNG